MVSIITTAYNRGKYIRETIESVLAQDYPNIEHIIVDGGSTDATVSILQQYSHLGDRFRFVSEPDRGQSHAVNKGLAMARGEIIGWLNSDDTYLPGAVTKAVHALQQRPDWAMLHGRAFFINEHSTVYGAVNYVAPCDYEKLLHGCNISHPTAFIRKSIFQQIGGADETLKFCMDYDLWIRIAKHHTIGFLDSYLANYRVHSTGQTILQWESVGVPEIIKTVAKHYGTVSHTWMSTYISQHREKGMFWFLNQFKSNRMLGNTPRVVGMNRYPDHWVPPLFRVTVEADPSLPLHLLLIKGKAFSSQLGQPSQIPCNVLINGLPAGNFTASAPAFIWEIPMQPNQPKYQIDILSSRFSNENHRTISYIVDEVLPLSFEEARIYKSYLKMHLKW